MNINRLAEYFTACYTVLKRLNKVETTVSLPLFSTDTIMYVQWYPDSSDIVPLQLHLDSLSVPPPVVINHTVINDLDEFYEYYDSQLSTTLDKADGMISQIEVTTETTWTDYLA